MKSLWNLRGKSQKRVETYRTAKVKRAKSQLEVKKINTNQRKIGRVIRKRKPNRREANPARKRGHFAWPGSFVMTICCREKAKTAKITKLDVGGFIIVPSTGFVPPGDKLSIDVEIEPHEAKGYKEKILLNIAEIEDKQKNKVLSLEAIGCEPKINLTDLESVFLEQFIVANVEDFVTPKNVSILVF